MSAALISENSMKLMKKRYLNGGESVDSMWDRVSGGEPRFRKLLEELRFLPNSPTLFNMGTGNGCTSSACFVFDIDDEMGPLPTDNPNSIVNTRGKAVAVAKAGGGVGYYFGNLRPRNAPIKSVHRKACGPVAVLRDMHQISQLITQGGKRELAQMGVLPVTHPDIEEFISCKDDDPQGLGSFNVSVSWFARSMAGVQDGEVAVMGLWNKQCRSAWKTGCPGMFFPDTVNAGNPNKHLGLINAPNPCGETPNRNNEPCNLGSLSLPRYWIKGRRGKSAIDLDRLAHDVHVATEFLDDILERNVFPHPEITKASLLTRKLGLGVMGWADLLALLHIHYDTHEAVDLGRSVMSLINQEALEASNDMAREKGPYGGFSADRTAGPVTRNETRTSIAPTGSIAIIADVWQSIEPHGFATPGEGERTTAEGMKLEAGVPRWVADNLDGFVPKTAHNIHWKWHVTHQAAFQSHTDLGVSKTVNLPKSASVQDVSDAYRLMYELGCKGGTIFRDGCRDEQVLVPKGKTKSVYLTAVEVPQAPERRKLETDADGEVSTVRHKFRAGQVKIYLHAGLYPDGSLGEIFLQASPQQGSSVDGMLDCFSKTFSLAIQRGVPLEDLVRMHKNTRFEPCGPTGRIRIPSCTSIPDYVARWLEWKFLKRPAADKEDGDESGVYCPDCGASTMYLAGCLTCSSRTCGWDRCG